MALRNRLNSVGRWLRGRAIAVRRRPWLLALILVAVIVTPGFYRLEQLSGGVKDNQVQTCVNGNDQRAATLRLWNFIFDLSVDDPKTPPTPAERMVLDQIRGWVNELYEPRDCTDLDKVYEIPPPPPILRGSP